MQNDPPLAENIRSNDVTFVLVPVVPAWRYQNKFRMFVVVVYKSMTIQINLMDI